MNYNNNKFEKTLSFGLSKIALWQLDIDKSEVELPALQRGFVWKVNQIEALWDSVLRGFPIGSFLLSKSEDEKLFLLDGQQRATSIALGFYNPWDLKDAKFWSLKKIPILWIDLAPREKTNTQKYVTRVVTQSHPWGYQRLNNNSILSVSDRRNALQIFKEIQDNKSEGYIHLSPLHIFPYDSDLPVPLCFVIKAIQESNFHWKYKLISLCKENLPIDRIKTKHSDDTKSYIERLSETINSSDFDNSIFDAINNLEQIEIPGIIVKKEILKTEEGHAGEDPTLFVRLNSSGTRIAGDELIYSIYKASFPEAKNLVENIGASFVAPSLVISLVSRLVLSQINSNSYPNAINVNVFIRLIQDEEFSENIRKWIGDNAESKAAKLFNQVFDLLLSKDDFAIPSVLVKNIIKGSPDLFLMLLEWVRIHIPNGQVIAQEKRRRILAAITALSWFGTDNAKYVREIWNNISQKEFWNKERLGIPFFSRRHFVMYPLIKPSTLREYLIQDVVENNVKWENLYPNSENEIIRTFKNVLSPEIEQESEIANAVKYMWNNFINKLVWNKSFVLFAQRDYINQCFGDFNQMETLEDTNTPWDWDHIYPASWVYAKWYIDPNTKHWTNIIGNFRAMSLEENRSENNSLSPKDRLIDVKEQSFIKDNDWEYWSKIESRINEGDSQMIKNHLGAIVNRLCNIYEEWYLILNVGELFNYQDENN